VRRELAKGMRRGCHEAGDCGDIQPRRFIVVRDDERYDLRTTVRLLIHASIWTIYAGVSNPSDARSRMNPPAIAAATATRDTTVRYLSSAQTSTATTMIAASPRSRSESEKPPRAHRMPLRFEHCGVLVVVHREKCAALFFGKHGGERRERLEAIHATVRDQVRTNLRPRRHMNAVERVERVHAEERDVAVGRDSCHVDTSGWEPASNMLRDF
jgi:hypothetical protein